MSFDPVLEASIEILKRARGFGEQTPAERGWEELLSWLVKRTQAVSGQLTLPAETVNIGRIDLPDLVAPVISVGELEKADLDEVGAWLSQTPSPQRDMAIYDGETRRFLACAIPGRSSVPAGWLILTFGADRALAAESCAALAAALAVVAVVLEQAHDVRSLRRHLDRFQDLYEVGENLTSTLDLDQVLRESTARVADVLDAEASTLLLVDEASRELVFKIPAGPAGYILVEKRMPIDKGAAGWVAVHGEPLIIADAERDSRFYTDIDHMTGYRTRSIMAVPLRNKGKIIGVVEVINKRVGDSFSTEDQQWLNTLAPLIAVAIENARLFAQERHLSEALREERDRIIVAEEHVRHELARNLHDGPAQIMAALILNIDMARRQLVSSPEKMATELNFLESLAQEANQEVRDLLFNLRPVSLEMHGLVAALRQLVERIQAHAAYKVHLEVPDLPGSIDPPVAGTLFVIIQEALNNIQKHAQAKDVWVRLGVSERALWIEVSDDGVGFDVVQVDAHYAQRNSFGLLNMRERARLIDGQTRNASPRPGYDNGTVVQVDVPLARALASGSSRG